MSARAENPKDPRVALAGRHRERGPARFPLTYEDIARVAQCAVKTVRNAAARRNGGPAPELDPRDLDSIYRFIHRRRERAQKRARKTEVA